MFQNAGEKGEPRRDPKDPPRRRGNKRRGHGTYENDRPPVVGTLGRESGLVQLRVAHRTDGAPLSAHVHQFTAPLLRYGQMDGADIMVLTGLLLSFVMVMVNGQEMTMLMVFVKSTSTRLKVCGQRSATFFAHFVMFIKSSSQDIFLSVSLLLISNLSLLSSYQNSSDAPNLNMSPLIFFSALAFSLQKGLQRSTIYQWSHLQP